MRRMPRTEEGELTVMEDLATPLAFDPTHIKRIRPVWRDIVLVANEISRCEAAETIFLIPVRAERRDFEETA